MKDNGGRAGEAEPREGAEQRAGRLPDRCQVVWAQAPGAVLDEQDHAWRDPDSEWLVSGMSVRPPGGFRLRTGASGRLRGRSGPEAGGWGHVHATRPGYASLIPAGGVRSSPPPRRPVHGHPVSGVPLLVFVTDAP